MAAKAGKLHWVSHSKTVKVARSAFPHLAKAGSGHRRKACPIKHQIRELPGFQLITYRLTPELSQTRLTRQSFMLWIYTGGNYISVLTAVRHSANMSCGYRMGILNALTAAIIVADRIGSTPLPEKKAICGSLLSMAYTVATAETSGLQRWIR